MNTSHLILLPRPVVLKRCTARHFNGTMILYYHTIQLNPTLKHCYPCACL